MKKRKKFNLPLSYEVSESSFDPERFLKLRVKVMHSGHNPNNSFFSSSVVEDAKPTIANIPILAFVKKEDGTSNDDFAGHEFEIKITEDGAKYVYLGRPIGIVPETNNYEVKVDEQGLEFIYVDAYVWTQYANSALDIINRDQVKKVSMEIIVNDYEWKDSYIDILDYSYTGIAMLGEDVREAMIGAKAEIINYTENKNAIAEMLFELKEALERGQKMEDVKKDFSEEEDKEIEEEEVETQEEDFSKEEDTQEEEVKEEDTQEEYTEEDDKENEEVAALMSEIETLKEENKDLKQQLETYESEKKQQKIDSLFSQFPDLDENEEAIALKNKALEFEMEDLELRLFALRGKYTTLNNENPEEETKKDKKKLIHEYTINSKPSGPSWAHLIEKSKEDK